MTTRAWVVVSVGLAIIAIIVAVIVPMQRQQRENAQAIAAPTSSAAPVTQEPPAASWAQVATLSGSTNGRGAPFTLSGGQQKLVYTMQGEDMSMLGIYVVAEGTSLQTQGGFPEVMPTAEGSGETRLAKELGSYYIDVTAANCTWSVTVYELR